MTELKHPELVAVAVATQLAKMVKATNDAARADAGDLLDDGDTVTLYSPSGTKLGKASRTDPEWQANVTDRAALEAWLRERYPDQVHTVDEVHPDTSSVLDVLREHAPHLVVQREVLADRMVPDVLAASLEAQQPMGPDGELDVPGVSVVKPPGVLTIRPDAKTATAAIAEMWQAGLILPDGTMRKALPAGGAE